MAEKVLGRSAGMDVTHNYGVVNEAPTHLEVHLNSIDEEEHHHDEEQHSITPVEDMSKEAPFLQRACLSSEEYLRHQEGVGQHIEGQETTEGLAQEPGSFTPDVSQMESLGPEADNEGAATEDDGVEGADERRCQLEVSVCRRGEVSSSQRGGNEGNDVKHLLSGDATRTAEGWCLLSHILGTHAHHQLGEADGGDQVEDGGEADEVSQVGLSTRVSFILYQTHTGPVETLAAARTVGLASV